jgi:hypothetical protein
MFAIFTDWGLDLEGGVKPNGRTAYVAIIPANRNIK